MSNKYHIKISVEEVPTFDQGNKESSPTESESKSQHQNQDLITIVEFSPSMLPLVKKYIACLQTALSILVERNEEYGPETWRHGELDSTMGILLNALITTTKAKRIINILNTVIKAQNSETDSSTSSTSRSPSIVIKKLKKALDNSLDCSNYAMFASIQLKEEIEKWQAIA